MIKRLEQVAALVVAAGLALVSYWLFFSWAQGGGSDRRPPRPLRDQGALPALRAASACSGIGGDPA
jgi:peptidoglycan/LPS O-acetylase OafA/YrhL